MHGYVAPLGGSFAVIDGGGLFSVAKGHKHEVELTFSPTERPATGKVMEVSTTLNINTDDPSHASFAIRLTGEVK